MLSSSYPTPKRPELSGGKQMNKRKFLKCFPLFLPDLFENADHFLYTPKNSKNVFLISRLMWTISIRDDTWCYVLFVSSIHPIFCCTQSFKNRSGQKTEGNISELLWLMASLLTEKSDTFPLIATCSLTGQFRFVVIFPSQAGRQARRGSRQGAGAR